MSIEEGHLLRVEMELHGSKDRVSLFIFGHAGVQLQSRFAKAVSSVVNLDEGGSTGSDEEPTGTSVVALTEGGEVQDVGSTASRSEQHEAESPKGRADEGVGGSGSVSLMVHVSLSVDVLVGVSVVNGAAQVLVRVSLLSKVVQADKVINLVFELFSDRHCF